MSTSSWTSFQPHPTFPGYYRVQCWPPCVIQQLPIFSVFRSVVSDSLPPHGLYSPWNSPGQDTGVGSLSLLQRIFPTQGSNLGLRHCRRILYQLSHKANPRTLEWVAYPFSSGSSWPRNGNGVSCIAGRLFTNWAIYDNMCFNVTLVMHPTLSFPCCVQSLFSVCISIPDLQIFYSWPASAPFFCIPYRCINIW